MKVEQISIFLENKSGRLAEVTRILADAKVNIRALSLADTSDFGVLRLLVDDIDKTKKALSEHNFTVGETEVVAVEVPDKPGGLHSILDILQQSGINVEYMYAFVQQSGNNAVMIFRFEDPQTAQQILQKNNITVIEGEKLYKM